jgi:hypothetical protein
VTSDLIVDQARRLGLGRLVYTFYHRPAGAIRRSVREGGPLAQRRTALGRREMEAAARELTPPPQGSGPALEVHLLTGNRFWYQTAFCLWSFAASARRTVAPVLYDDGTLAPDQRDVLRRVFPRARFVTYDECLSRMNEAFPEKRFPVLRERWMNYPHIRKLTDPHAGQSGWKLVMDSDLLFFRAPALLIDWLDAPTRPLHAVDFADSYGYSRELLDSLADAPVSDRVNVGLTGLSAESIDWDRVERWCRTLIEREGTHYFLEQAIVAMLIAGRETAAMPAHQYVTLPQLPEATDCRAVMHHYVEQSKRWYFQRNWRRVIAEA